MKFDGAATDPQIEFPAPFASHTHDFLMSQVFTTCVSAT